MRNCYYCLWQALQSNSNNINIVGHSKLQWNQTLNRNGLVLFQITYMMINDTLSY
jgi:hypothetical protein